MIHLQILYVNKLYILLAKLIFIVKIKIYKKNCRILF
jgi:hypothetical protein